MNEPGDDPRQPPATPGEDDADVARLLRLAAAPLPPERRAAAFDRVHAEWRSAVAAPAAPEPRAVPGASSSAQPAPSIAAQRPRRTSWWGALAASVAVAALGVALFGGGPGAGSSPVAVAQVVAGPQATLQGQGRLDRLLGRERALLADTAVQSGESLVTGAGTAVLLRVGTRLTLRLAPQSRLRFDGPAAVTLLAGQVYVDSGASDGAANPLTVATPHGDVRHVGTRYLVRLEPSALEVAVREGRVRLSPASTSAGASQPVEAGAGERLRLMAGTGAVARDRIAPSADEWAWLGRIPAPIAIDGATLGQFLGWYEAESGRRVEYGASARESRLDDVRLRGSVAGLSPDEALDSVAAIADLAVRRTPDGVTIDAAAR